MWAKVARQLPADVRTVAIDLLGYGDSPKPDYKEYDIRTQSLSLLTTLPKLKLSKPVILIGHSLGALVAIDLAKNYPLLIKSLILCSPPLYKSVDSQALREKNLRRVYMALSESKVARDVLLNAKAYQKINPGYSINQSNVGIFFKTLVSAIVEQNSIKQLAKIKKPAKILYGSLDLVIIPRNIQEVAAKNKYVSSKVMPLLGHEVNRLYRKVLVQTINQEISRVAA